MNSRARRRRERCWYSPWLYSPTDETANLPQLDAINFTVMDEICRMPSPRQYKRLRKLLRSKL